MLSHALLETWKRRQGRMLTLNGYTAVGGVRKAIAAKKHIYCEKPSATTSAEALALVRVDEGLEVGPAARGEDADLHARNSTGDSGPDPSAT